MGIFLVTYSQSADLQHIKNIGHITVYRYADLWIDCVGTLAVWIGCIGMLIVWIGCIGMLTVWIGCIGMLTVWIG